MTHQLLGVLKLVMAISPDAAIVLVKALRPEAIKNLNERIDKEFVILNNIIAPSVYDVERINDLTGVRKLLDRTND